MALHVSPISWSVMDIKNAPMAATSTPDTVEIGLVQQKGSHVPPSIHDAYPPYRSVTAMKIALTEVMSPKKFVEVQVLDAAGR